MFGFKMFRITENENR